MSHTSRLPRYALYGGAFDPPHNAHVDMVRQLVAQCDLDQVWVVPTGQAWHKPRTLTDAVHRLAMTRLAFADVPEAVVDDREMRRDGPSYTVDTLAELQATNPPADWFVLMGQDQWATFPTWNQWQTIAENASIVIADRTIQLSDEGLKNIKHSSANGTDVPPGLPQPIQLNWNQTAISSTAARQNPTQASALLPNAVASYISEHFLYTSPT